MLDEQIPADAAGDEDVIDQVTEATEDEGQVEGQPAEETDGDEKPEGPEDEISRSKARRERRKAELDRLRASEAEAKAQLAKTEARLERIEKVRQGQQPPKEADYQDYALYQADLAVYRSMQALDERAKGDIGEEAQAQKAQVTEIERQRQAEVAQNWRDQVDDAKTRYSDFEQVAYTAPLSPAMESMVLSSDTGADVAYYLGKNKAEAATIAKMSDLDAARAIGRIEARITTPQPRLNTNAPEPITPVRSKATAAKDPEKMSFSEYEAARKAGKI